jgi:hypothetical protein
MIDSRFRFNKIRIDSTWDDKFSDEALIYLENQEQWLYKKLSSIMNNKVPYLDFIIIYDSCDIQLHKNFIDIKMVLVASDSEFYKCYDNMFFTDNPQRAAIQNLQSENEVIKEIAVAIVKGSSIFLDNTIMFPYTKDNWILPTKNIRI